MPPSSFWTNSERVACLGLAHHRRPVTKHLPARLSAAHYPRHPRRRHPRGEWTELVGSAFDRCIYVYQVDTTPEQDEHLIASFNDRKNVAQYNMLHRNCADLSRSVFNLLYPGAVHRNVFADWGIMTPKQVARSLVSYARKHPEVGLKVFVIPQVPGTVPRSHSIYGCAEGFVKSKKYVLPSVLLSPYFTAGMLAVYVVDGRFSPPKNLPPLPLTLSAPVTASFTASMTPFSSSTSVFDSKVASRGASLSAPRANPFLTAPATN
jgi:hypothetical protein